MLLWHRAVVFLKGFTLLIDRQCITDLTGSSPPDRELMKTYLRLLDADRDRADWREAAAIILHLDVEKDPEGSHALFEKSLKQALWLRDHGYLDLARTTTS